MKIRDIKGYIADICGSDSLYNLGNDNDILLNRMHGGGQQVKALITSVASFASNSEEQLFYEFVQNALDANSNSLFFYANKKYLIVLNNGEPFYTDINRSQTANLRDGQLYNFLAKGKSLKFDDITKKGKFGQGSKLLYTLITDDGIGGNDSALIKSIYNDKKGPYLISWANASQLNNFLLNRVLWEYADPNDVDNSLLVAKILMSYYPIAPGVEESLFSAKEVTDIIAAFNKLVDPKRNINRLVRGTALIIPLGEGKYEKIVSSENITKVRTRIGGFAAMNYDQEIYGGARLENINIMGEEMIQIPVKSVFVDFEAGGQEFKYQFAFNPVFAQNGYVNFLNALPILQTRFGLGFMVDSPNFEMDSSRQRINDTDKTKEQLILAFEKLVIKLNEIKDEDKDLFDYIYQSIIASRISDDPEVKYIKDAFNDVLIPFIKQNILTLDGDYVDIDSARHPSFLLSLPLVALGINQWQWVDDKAYEDIYANHNISIHHMSFVDTICEATTGKLQRWIKSLDLHDYTTFENICSSEQIANSYPHYPLFRSNCGTIYSYDTLISTAPIFCAKDGLPSSIYNACNGKIEFVTFQIDPSKWAEVTLSKMVSNITIFRESNIGRECACSILEYIYKNYSSQKEKIRSNVKLLPNKLGEYMPFDQLLYERPNDTIIFESFTTKGYVPQIARKEWFVNSDSYTELWSWLVSNIDEIKSLNDWKDNSIQYIKDIREIYDKSASQGGFMTSKAMVSLSLSPEGIPTDVICDFITGSTNLNEDEYMVMQEMFSDTTFVPYRYASLLSREPFKVERSSVIEYISNGSTVNIEQLKLLIKLDSGILDKVHIEESRDGFKLTKDECGYKGYILPADIIGEERDILIKAMSTIGYHFICESVGALIPKENLKDYDLTTDNEKIIPIIKRCVGRKYLLPIVRKCSESVIETYIESLGDINIEKSISSECIEWQIIMFAAERGFTNDVKSKIKHNGIFIPETVSIDEWTYNEHQYSLYELDSQIKAENKNIEELFKLLPDPKYFRDKYYANSTSVDADELYEKLHNQYLTVGELRFCLDYSFANDVKYNELELDEEEDLYAALQMIKECEYIHFDKYFKIRGFNNETQVYADNTLLLKEEQLPLELTMWLERGDVSNYISSLRTMSDPYIQVRQAINIGINYNFEPSLFRCKTELSTLQTELLAKWLVASKYDVIYNTTRYDVIGKVIDIIPKKCETKIFLRYTGRILDEGTSNRDSIIKRISPIYTVELYNEDSLFLYSYDVQSNFGFRDLMNTDIGLRNVFETNVIFESSYDLVRKHSIEDSQIVQLSDIAESSQTKELEDNIYAKWRQLEASANIRIYVSESDIKRVIKLTNKGDQSELYSKSVTSSDYGANNTAKSIIVKWRKGDNRSIMKKLESCSNEVQFFKDPFIALQGLYVEQLELLQLAADQKGVDIENLIVNYTNPDASKKGGNSANLPSKLQNKTPNEIQSLEKVSETFTPEELNFIAEHKDAVQDVIQDVTQDLIEEIEEEQVSQARKTIEFIGELIYEYYLRDQLQVEYEYSAQEGVGEYDFKRKDNNTYVDIKTCLYSIRSGAVPFYLHKLQNQFMQQNPNAPFRIVRISLKDLDLVKSYERIRDTYGVDSDYEYNKELRKECEKIARNYWRTATVSEFEASAPEFSISINKR